MTLVITGAAAHDLEDWVAMRCQLWPDLSESQQRSELEDLMARHGYRGWIAREDGKAAGFAEACIRPYANGCDSTPVPFLEGVWVEPALRHLGIGARLVGQVEAWAAAQGFSELGSDVDIANLISQAAHQAWGFEERETVVYYRRRLCPSREE